jgi:hypothetical protein
MIKQTVFHLRLRELFNGTLLELGQNPTGLIVLAAGTIILLARDFITERGTDCGKMLNNARPVLQFVVLLAALASIVIFVFYSGEAHSASFIYAGL